MEGGNIIALYAILMFSKHLIIEVEMKNWLWFHVNSVQTGIYVVFFMELFSLQK